MTDAELKEKIQITLEENGLQFKYDFTYFLVDDLLSLTKQYAREQQVIGYEALLRMGMVASELAVRQNDKQATKIIKSIMDKYDNLLAKLEEGK